MDIHTDPTARDLQEGMRDPLLPLYIIALHAKSEREKVSTELKAAVTAAREAYKAAKENLDATYEELYQQEFDKIASEYKAVKKRKRRK